jgi:hypothetical protein
MTMIELALTLLVIGVLGIAVATLSAAAADAWNTRDQYRRQTADGRIMQHRLADLIRGARRVVNSHDAGQGRYADVMLWIADTQDPGQVNLAELALVSYDTQTSSLRLYLPEMTDGERGNPLTNPVVAPATAATAGYAQQFRTNASVVPHLLSENIHAMQVTLGDKPAPYSFIELRLTLSGVTGDQAITQVIAAALRAPETDIDFGTGGSP